MTYFLTFSCYGARLHGNPAGSIDRHHNLVGTRLLPPNPARETAERRAMRHPPYHLDEQRRAIALRAIQQHCAYRGWTLLAAHIRSTHVHTVIQSDAQPERILNELKSHASRELNSCGLDDPAILRWYRHGSTVWLWSKQQVTDAIHYVVDAQGAPMALHAAPLNP